MITDPTRVPLGARAWLGNGSFGALVSADGTIDWYCPAGIGGPAALWRLLDPAGGAVRVGPERSGSGAARSLPPGEQRYLAGSNVVETVLEGRGGRRVSVTDLLVWPGPGLEVDGRLVRVVRALAGPVEVEVEVYPSGRFGPARDVVPAPAGVIVAGGFSVSCGFELEPSPIDRNTPRWRGVRRLDEGEGFAVTIDGSPDSRPLTFDAALRLAEMTEAAWRSWVAVLAYGGPYRRAVERSVLAVRSLTGRAGAPVAAGTTSLPRRVGSERNADGRWVSWHDAAAAASVFASAGFAEDAEAAEGWLRAAVTEAPLPWPAWLDTEGRDAPPDLDTLGLSGWRRTQPVVTGVRADTVDLDSYGSVVAAIGASTRGPGGRADDPGALSAAWPALTEATGWITDHWMDNDSGVWGPGGAAAAGAGLPVASRVQAWSGLDRMIRLARAANPLDLSAAAWQQEARSILAWLEDDGLAFDGGLRGDGRASADDEPDAALLRVAWRGPWPASERIVATTVGRILERLGSGNLVYRHSDRVDDGQAGPDSPDLLASLWAVRALACLGRWDEAHGRMETIVGLAGPCGLLSEAADPVSGELMGNLPSSGVHLAVVDAAMALEDGPA